MPRISIIIPCYFNEENIPVTGQALIDNESNFPEDVTFEYVLIDDGSGDQTWSELVKFRDAYPEKVKVIKLVRNFGAINADLAGLQFATGDCNVILSADLQDPPEIIPKMYEYWQQGIKLVIANREGRDEGFLKRLFAGTTHIMIRKLGLPKLPHGGFDLVLFDKEIKEQTNNVVVKNTSLQYLYIWFGYDYVTIPYQRRKREIGRSRWTLGKKLKLFVDSFVSYSFLPIRLISLSGFLLGFAAVIYAIFILWAKLRDNIPIEGWSSTMLVMLLVGAFQMIALGIIGEYVWRNLDYSRNRPNFLIDETRLPLDQAEKNDSASSNLKLDN